MRYCEIVPRNGYHYVTVDGVEWSRHDDVEVAEKVRSGIIEAALCHHNQEGDDEKTNEQCTTV
jgi:hypothetical protein